MRIARVFPRRTNATPTDRLAFSMMLPPVAMPEVDEIHFSVAFTYDIPKAEAWAEQWRVLGVPIKFGGPAYGNPGGEFEPGMYLKPGYVITSRGCPNHCWFCSVPKREGVLRELTIKDGWNVLDDNLLACSDQHVRAVFAMLEKQPRQPVFTGGLEAKILKPWHAEELRRIKTKRMYFAYDTPDDYEPLVEAGKLLQSVGFTVAGHSMMCYVLIGYRGDTFEKAEKRLRQTVDAGYMPMAMLYKDEQGHEDEQWRRFQRQWANKSITGTKMKEGRT
jgi:hypothetical protein